MQIDMARNVTKKWPFNCNSNFVLENWRAYFQILGAIFSDLLSSIITISVRIKETMLTT
jgi:hypothetical protein